jgi:chemotaxis protein methyltransferase CheR
MGFDELPPFVRWLVNAPHAPLQLELVASKLTVGETYFFREPQAFAALREHVVPGLVAARKSEIPQLRVWSAGCCTGEEAYSLAIFFVRECPELRDWRISILGTDINPHFLRKARAGIFRGWSFRGAPAWLQRDYFSSLGGDRFELRADIRRMVTFAHLNLADDVYPSLHNQTNGLDLIFCRNVLMYFSPAQLRRTVEGFHRSLVEGGHLVVGVCEAAPTLAPEFHARAFPGATLYQKRGDREDEEPAQATEIGECQRSDLFSSWGNAPEIGAAETAKAESPFHGSALPPAYAESPLARAQERIAAGDYAAAAAELETAAAHVPLDVEVATLLARALANQGRLADARRWIERAIAADKLRAPLHYLRATVLQEMGELELAADALEKTLYLDPDFVLAHVASAELARRSGRAEKSVRHLERALRVLRRHRSEDVIAESGELTAGRLIAVIETMLTLEVAP